MSSPRSRRGTAASSSEADGGLLQCPSCWYQSRVDWMQRGGLVWYDSSYFKRRVKPVPVAALSIQDDDRGKEGEHGTNPSSSLPASSQSSATHATDSMWCRCIVWNWPFFATSEAPGWRLERSPAADEESYIIYPIEEPAGCWCWLAPVCCLYSACVDSASALFIIHSQEPVSYSSSPEPRQSTLRCELRAKSAASEEVVDHRDFITKAEVQLLEAKKYPQAKLIIHSHDGHAPLVLTLGALHAQNNFQALKDFADLINKSVREISPHLAISPQSPIQFTMARPPHARSLGSSSISPAPAVPVISSSLRFFGAPNNAPQKVHKIGVFSPVDGRLGSSTEPYNDVSGTHHAGGVDSWWTSLDAPDWKEDGINMGHAAGGTSGVATVTSEGGSRDKDHVENQGRASEDGSDTTEYEDDDEVYSDNDDDVDFFADDTAGGGDPIDTAHPGRIRRRTKAVARRTIVRTDGGGVDTRRRTMRGGGSSPHSSSVHAPSASTPTSRGAVPTASPDSSQRKPLSPQSPHHLLSQGLAASTPIANTARTTGGDASTNSRPAMPSGAMSEVDNSVDLESLLATFNSTGGESQFYPTDQRSRFRGADMSSGFNDSDLGSVGIEDDIRPAAMVSGSTLGGQHSSNKEQSSGRDTTRGDGDGVASGGDENSHGGVIAIQELLDLEALLV